MTAPESILFSSCLLIEDDPSHALLVKRALKDVCAVTQHCESLKTALEELRTQSPDIIITDLNLPDSSKVENVGRLQAQCPGCPIVVLTSSTSLEDAVAAMKLGARDFIVKNFDSNFRDILHLALSRIHAALRIEADRSRLQSEMEALRLAIENSNDGLAVTNARGEIVYSNRAFRGFVRSCGGDPGKIRELAGPGVEHRQKLQENIGEKYAALSTGAVWHTEVRFVEDRNLAYDLSLSVIRSAAADEQGAASAGTPGGNECVIWVRNVTEERRREKFQREILSTTTHDLKGPLGTISLSTELLGPLVTADQRAAEIVKRIASLAASASNLIEEFLSARRIKEGTFIMKPARHDVVHLAKTVIGDFEPQAAVKSIALNIETEQQSLVWCLDRLGLQRVLGNLLSNAIKFTPRSGTIKAGIQVLQGELHIAVIDTGSGMEPSEVNRIFERFTRLDRHADVAGSGIGLFVVKSIVAAHGGTVEVTSQPGKGTVFDVVLPENPPVNERGELISLGFV